MQDLRDICLVEHQSSCSSWVDGIAVWTSSRKTMAVDEDLLVVVEALDAEGVGPHQAAERFVGEQVLQQRP
jgi:hypothetical protein